MSPYFKLRPSSPSYTHKYLLNQPEKEIRNFYPIRAVTTELVPSSARAPQALALAGVAAVGADVIRQQLASEVRQLGSNLYRRGREAYENWRNTPSEASQPAYTRVQRPRLTYNRLNTDYTRRHYLSILGQLRSRHPRYRRRYSRFRNFRRFTRRYRQ